MMEVRDNTNTCRCYKTAKRHSIQKVDKSFQTTFLCSFSNRRFSLFLLCTVLFCYSFVPAEGQHMDFNNGHGVQPSKVLLPIFDKNADLESELFFENEDGNPDTNLRENVCRFVARTGRLFNQSLADKLPNLHLESSEKPKVQISNDEISDWLFYDEKSNSLRGVPLTHHTEKSFQIIISSPESLFQVHCTVDVENFEDDDPHWEDNVEDLGCFPDEALVVLALRFDVNRDQLGPRERVQLLSTITQFVRSLGRCENCIVAMETDRDEVHSAFLSGVGNLNRNPLHLVGVDVSWFLGCASDKLEFETLDPVEKAAQNGSLAQATGYDVIEWRVENRKQDIPHLKQLSRMKRRARGSKRKSKKKKAKKEYAGFDPEAGDDPQDSELQENIASRVSKVPNYMNRQSPGLPPINASPAIPDRVSRPSILPQNSPSVGPPSLSPVRHRPEVKDGFDDIRVYTSTYFEAEISRHVFSDVEDGNTRQLSLKIMATYPMITSKTWLKLGPNQDLIYGIPPKDHNGNTMLDYYKFLLMAKDKDRKTASTSFKVFLNPIPQYLNHRIIFALKKQNNIENKNDFFRNFSKILSEALGEEKESLMPPGKITILEFDESSSKIIWFDNSLGSANQCPRRSLRELSLMMTGKTLKETSDRRSSPTSNFKDKFLPDFKIKSIKFSLSGPCLLPEDKKEVIIETPTASTTSRSTTTQKPATTTTKPTKKPPPPPPTTTTTLTTSTTTSKKTSKTTTVTVVTTPPTMRPTTSTASPLSNIPQLSPIVMSTFEGKLAVKNIKRDQIIGNSAFNPSKAPKLKLRSDLNGLPAWINLDPEKWTIIALPTAPYLSSLNFYNSTHKMWKGKLYLQQESQKLSKTVPITIYVATLPSSGDSMRNVTHLFKMKITNYEVQNFTVIESLRLLNVIRNFYGDETFEWIYVYPIESGSVLFSWHNTSLSYATLCPVRKIAELGSVVFQSKKDRTGIEVSNNAKKSLLKAGFQVTFLDLLRMNACAHTTPKMTSTTPRKVNLAATSKTTTTLQENTEDGISSKPQKGNASIIIVVAVIVCILILVIIFVVKCRTRMKAEKRNNTPGAVSFTEAEPLNRLPLNSSLDRRPNHNTPVVLAGEEDENDTLVKSQNQDQTSFSNNREDIALTHHANGQKTISANDVRPPPPPYIGKSVAT